MPFISNTMSQYALDIVSESSKAPSPQNILYILESSDLNETDSVVSSPTKSLTISLNLVDVQLVKLWLDDEGLIESELADLAVSGLSGKSPLKSV